MSKPFRVLLRDHRALPLLGLAPRVGPRLCCVAGSSQQQSGVLPPAGHLWNQRAAWVLMASLLGGATAPDGGAVWEGGPLKPHKGAHKGTPCPVMGLKCGVQPSETQFLSVM